MIRFILEAAAVMLAAFTFGLLIARMFAGSGYGG